MDQQRWNMGTTIMLSLLIFRKGKKGRGQKDVRASETLVGRPQRHSVLTVYSFDGSQRTSAWGTVVGLVWTHLEACTVHFFPFLQFKLLPPIYSFKFDPTFIHLIPIAVASGWWEKLGNGKKRETRTHVFTTLPPVLYLPVYYWRDNSLVSIKQ